MVLRTSVCGARAGRIAICLDPTFTASYVDNLLPQAFSAMGRRPFFSYKFTARLAGKHDCFQYDLFFF